MGEWGCVGLTGKVTFEQRLKANEGVIQGFLWEQCSGQGEELKPSPQPCVPGVLEEN